MTREQLDLARRMAFGLNDNALQTLEDARAWVDRMGLVLWAPKGQQLPIPAPSFVSAVTGVAEPGIAEAETAKQMLGRLVREGSAVPLYLMGNAAPGDTTDYVVSTTSLAFVYTLKGDKNWKKEPSPSSLSPLSFKVWNTLKAGGPQTASQLVQELGREVTQAAVLRALSELWAILRVIPVPQDDGQESIWELLSARFTKSIKAGGNAGVPSALSALISQYLGAVLVAETEEIEIFLSPLIARSKVREAVNGLNAGRQLDEVVLEGKTLLHVRGELPEMPEVPVTETTAQEGVENTVDLGDVGDAEPNRDALLERSRKRVEKTFTEDRERKVPVRTRRPFDPEKKPYVRKPAAEGERPARRSFDGERKPYVRKPFDGERKPFRPREEGAGGGERRPYTRKPFDGDRGPRREFTGERKPFRPREDRGGDRPAFRERKPFDGERKPFRPRTEGEAGERPARRPFTGERKSFGGDRDRKPYARKPFDGERKPFRPRTEGEAGDRPARRPFTGERKSFGGDRDRKPFVRKPFDGERKPFRPRTEGEAGDRPARRPFTGERKSFGGGERKPFVKKPFDGERKSYRPRTEGEGGERPRRPFTGDRKPSFGGPKKFGSKPGGAGKFGGPKKFANKPGGAGKFGPKKFGPKPGGPAKPRAPRKKREDE